MLLFLIVVFVSNDIISKTINIDSLKKVVSTASIPVIDNFNATKELTSYYKNRNLDSAKYFCNQLITIANNDSSLLSKSYYEFAMLSNAESKFETGLLYLDSALMFDNEQITTTQNVAYLNFAGICYWYLGDYNKALDVYLKAIKLPNLDRLTQQKLYTNIGILYRNLNDFNKAYYYLNKSKLISDKQNDLWNYSNTMINLGVIYLEGKISNDSALFCFKTGYEGMLELKDLWGQSMALTNIGTLLSETKNHKESIFYLEKSIELDKIMQDEEGLVYGYLNLGISYRELDKFEQSIEFIKQAYDLAVKIKSKDNIRAVSKQLSKSYSYLNDYKNELKYYKIFSAYNDSLFNESKSKEIGKLEATYEMEKKQAEEEQKLKEESRKLKEETERRDNLQYSIIFIVILAVFGAVLALGKIKISPKFAEGLIFFAFLIFFEFCLVLLDPYIDNYSGGEPAYKLLFNAVLAGAIFPLHAFFEKALNKLLKQ